MRPRVDDLIVLFTLRDEPVEILLLVLLDRVLGIGDQLLLRFRNDEIVFTERDARLASVTEAQNHEAVCEDNGLLLATMAVNFIDDSRNFLLAQQFIDQPAGNIWVAWQYLGQEHTAGCGFKPYRDRVAIGV